MAVSPLETKAHELIGQISPTEFAAVVHLLEVMIEDEEPVTGEDRRRFHEGLAFFAGGKGILMEKVLSEFGMKPEDFPQSN